MAIIVMKMFFFSMQDEASTNFPIVSWFCLDHSYNFDRVTRLFHIDYMFYFKYI